MCTVWDQYTIHHIAFSLIGAPYYFRCLFTDASESKHETCTKTYKKYLHPSRKIFSPLKKTYLINCHRVTIRKHRMLQFTTVRGSQKLHGSVQKDKG